MAGAGGALFGAMATLREGHSPLGLDLAALNGQDTDIAIDMIVQALATEDGDSDRVRVAMNEALSECLEGYQEFDFGAGRLAGCRPDHRLPPHQSQGRSHAESGRPSG